MRRCCQCGAPDHEILIPNADSQHFVKPEIMRPRQEFRPRVHARKGWRPKVVQGVTELVRDICVDCLNANEIRDQVWGEMRRTALRLEKKPNQDAEYYALLCD